MAATSSRAPRSKGTSERRAAGDQQKRGLPREPKSDQVGIRLRSTEFTSLCSAKIEIAIARRSREAAQGWIQIWESVIPNDPNLERHRSCLLDYQVRSASDHLAFQKEARR